MAEDEVGGKWVLGVFLTVGREFAAVVHVEVEVETVFPDYRFLSPMLFI
jgi:hypothetical protein